MCEINEELSNVIGDFAWMLPCFVETSKDDFLKLITSAYCEENAKTQEAIQLIEESDILSITRFPDHYKITML